MLHVINDLDPEGGAQGIVRDLTSRTPDGVEWSILTLSAISQGIAQDLSARGVHHSHLYPLRPGSIRAARHMLGRADVLHVHLFPSLYWAALSSKPKVFTEHNTHNRRRNHSHLRFLDHLVYRRYDRIACISPEARSALESWLGSETKQRGDWLCVVSNGVRLERFQGFPRKSPHGEIHIAMIGSFAVQKDQATLVRAMAALPPSFRLSFVGSGPLQGEVVSLCRTLGLAERVSFLGYVAPSEIPAVLATTDVYVQSSHWEGFGLAAVEAMASGVPTLGSSVPGLSGVIGDPDLLFPAGDDVALARLLLEVTDPQRYVSLSQAALQRAQTFDSVQMSESYLRVYRELIDARE